MTISVNIFGPSTTTGFNFVSASSGPILADISSVFYDDDPGDYDVGFVDTTFGVNWLADGYFGNPITEDVPLLDTSVSRMLGIGQFASGDVRAFVNFDSTDQLTLRDLLNTTWNALFDRGSNSIKLSNFNDVVDAGIGNDTVFGFGGDDVLFGGVGRDTLRSGDGDDEVFGGTGNDRIFGGNGADELEGNAGNDLIYGNFGDDIIDGGAGKDTLIGGLGNDVLSGGASRDRLKGLAGDDILDGGAGHDTLLGGFGDDTLAGGTGVNTLTGGGGNDTFIFAGGRTIIKDFRDKKDNIVSNFNPDGDTDVEAFLLENSQVSRGDLLITFGDGNTIFIRDLTDVTALFDDFSFA